MNKKILKLPTMKQIHTEAEALSYFTGTPMQNQVNDDEDDYDGDDDYDGFNDDDLHFDGKAQSFHDAHKSNRMLSLTIINGNNTDVTVGLNASFKAAFANCGEGATTSIEGSNITVRSNATYTKLVPTQKLSFINPLQVIGLRVTFTQPTQASKLISYSYQSNWASPKTYELQPESYRTEKNQQDKIITIPVGFVWGNQTDFLVQVAANETLNLFVMFGAEYNTSKSLGKKVKRAAATLPPSATV
jgi:hypothetical protein